MINHRLQPVDLYLWARSNRITRMFCEHQTYAQNLLVNTHDTILARMQQLDRKGSNFLLIWLIHKGFSLAIYSSNTVYVRGARCGQCMYNVLRVYKLDEWCEFVLGNFRNFWQLVSSNYFVQSSQQYRQFYGIRSNVSPWKFDLAYAVKKMLIPLTT